MYNLNSEFDVIDPATFFINSSFGMGAEYAQSGKNGPSSFPYSSLGLRTTARINNNTLLKLAILDGVSGDPARPTRNSQLFPKGDGLLIASELTLFTDREHKRTDQSIDRKDISRRIKVGRNKPENDYNKLNVGGWCYTSSFVPLYDSAQNARGNAGLYVGYQQYFPTNTSKGQYFSVFSRAGISNGRFNRLSSSINGGIVFHELIGHDQVGLAFTSAINGRDYNRLVPESESMETAIELMYINYLTHYLTIQPDIQYILNPNTNAQLKNALSVSLLLQASFSL